LAARKMRQGRGVSFATWSPRRCARLSEVRAAIAGEIQDAGGIEAVRSALTRIFECFVIRRSKKSVHVELAWLGEGDLVIEPVVKEQFHRGIFGESPPAAAPGTA
jgi:hypothetical protein